jgi:hypothetical protein
MQGGPGEKRPGTGDAIFNTPLKPESGLNGAPNFCLGFDT